MHPDDDEPDLDDVELVPEQRLVIDVLACGLTEILEKHRWIFEEPQRFADLAIATLGAAPITAIRIARGVLYAGDVESRTRLVRAFLDHEDRSVFPALLQYHAPYRYDRPGADPAHAFLPRDEWRAMLHRALAQSPAVRLDAIRLIFASADGDAFVDELAVYSDTDDRVVLQVIWFALSAATSDAARILRRDLETRDELAWVPAWLRVT